MCWIYWIYFYYNIWCWINLLHQLLTVLTGHARNIANYFEKHTINFVQVRYTTNVKPNCAIVNSNWGPAATDFRFSKDISEQWSPEVSFPNKLVQSFYTTTIARTITKSMCYRSGLMLHWEADKRTLVRR